MKLRDYQLKGAEQGCEILQRLGIVYYVWSVRTGKTLTSLQCANLYGASSVLFITKKKAIKSIENDYTSLSPDYTIEIINYESLHKVEHNNFDLIILDEHHGNSAFPKPNTRAKEIKKRFGHLPMIFLSGTPSIESGSQWYHSFWVSNKNPFKQWSTFYKWSNEFTNPKIKHFGALQVKDYSDAKTEIIMPYINDYILTYTQEEAGFTSTIDENILYCEMSEQTNSIVKMLLKSSIVEGKDEVILADTPAKLMSKVHQVSNGTVIFESGKTMILDDTKAKFILERFKGLKVALFYNYKAELLLLQHTFGESLTTDLDEFNITDKHIALQQVSGSEGISLKAADVLVYYSFGFSGKNYVQGRDRLTTIDRVENNVYFVFQKGDINEKIYRVIKSKKKYNEKLFTKEKWD
jgi:hypothetical protein